jgi:hypothetical protein
MAHPAGERALTSRDELVADWRLPHRPTTALDLVSAHDLAEQSDDLERILATISEWDRATPS